MKNAEVVVVHKSYGFLGQTYEIYSLEHPEGVECLFINYQCSCGRLDVGLRSDLPPNLDGQPPASDAKAREKLSPVPAPSKTSQKSPRVDGNERI